VHFLWNRKLAGKGPQRMALDRRFAGREEKRVPVLMEVKLVPAEGTKEERWERAVVENISALGARVLGRVPWQSGEQVEVTPAVGEAPLRAEVVYCQKLGKEQFVVGLKFRRQAMLLSILEKLKGLVR